MDMQCRCSAHLLQNEIANLRKDTGFHEVKESDGVKLLRSYSKSSSIEGLAEIILAMIEKEEIKEAYIIATSKENQEIERPLGKCIKLSSNPAI